MHLQASVEGFDVFARSLSIGAETMVMHFEPDRADARPLRRSRTTSCTPEIGDEVLTIGRLVNAFFRWEFNSCETLVTGGEVHPIDYANACPDVAITSLHYYFPWAIRRCSSGRSSAPSPAGRCALDLDTRRYFEIGDREDLSYEEKLAELPRLADDLLRGRPLPGVLRQPPRARRRAACSSGSPRPTSTACWSTTVRSTYPAHEHDSSCRTSAACWRPGPRTSTRRRRRVEDRAAGRNQVGAREALEMTVEIIPPFNVTDGDDVFLIDVDSDSGIERARTEGVGLDLIEWLGRSTRDAERENAVDISIPTYGADRLTFERLRVVVGGSAVAIRLYSNESGSNDGWLGARDGIRRRWSPAKKGSAVTSAS